MRPNRIVNVAWLVGSALVLAACGGDPDLRAATSTTSSVATAPAITNVPTTVVAADPTSTTVAELDSVSPSVVESLAGADWFLGRVPAEPVAADAHLDPIRLGMINQEDTPLGSYPELRVAAEAAVAWINAELGGVAGRPLELLSCVTSFDPVQSRACALELLEPQSSPCMSALATERELHALAADSGLSLSPQLLGVVLELLRLDVTPQALLMMLRRVMVRSVELQRAPQ